MGRAETDRREAPGPLVSVIVPAWREERLIGASVRSVRGQEGGVPFELIVVDGGSPDATVARAREAGAATILQAPRGKARQANVGAAAARGEWLLFLHADSRLGPQALASLARAARRPGVVGGGFAVRFEPSGPALVAAGALHSWRGAVTGVPYGDQAAWVRRDVFRRLGGFREESPLPDVDLGRRLRREGRTLLLRKPPVVTSARRFTNHGPVRTMAVAAAILGWELLTGRVIRSRVFFEDRR